MKQPWSDLAWVFELKHDGFRGLLYIRDGAMAIAEFVSRNGNVMRRFSDLAGAIARGMPEGGAVIDGEICHLNEHGEPQFYDLMRRGATHFCAFDLLWVDGEDLRRQQLVERKRRLRELVKKDDASPIRYVDHIEADGVPFYRLVCERDMEGIVAKRADGLYTPEETTWVKVKNPRYSQNDGRRELFERRSRF